MTTTDFYNHTSELKLIPGTIVRISVQPKVGTSSFNVNLQTGSSVSDSVNDLALHMSFQFSPPKFVRNSLIDGEWGVEETQMKGFGSTLSAGQEFVIELLNDADHFRIAIKTVQAVNWCEYKHRIPYEKITHLRIQGDVVVKLITTDSPPYVCHPTNTS